MPINISSLTLMRKAAEIGEVVVYDTPSVGVKSVATQLEERVAALAKDYETISVYTPISDRFKLRNIVPLGCVVEKINREIVVWLDETQTRRKVKMYYAREDATVRGDVSDCIVMHCEARCENLFPLGLFLDAIAPQLIVEKVELILFLSQANCDLLKA